MGVTKWPTGDACRSRFHGTSFLYVCHCRALRKLSCCLVYTQQQFGGHTCWHRGESGILCLTTSPPEACRAPTCKHKSALTSSLRGFLKANQDPRTSRRPSWHTQIGCTTAGGANLKAQLLGHICCRHGIGQVLLAH